MLRHLIALCLCMTPILARADAPDPGQIVTAQVLPGYQALALASTRLQTAAEADCRPDNAALRDAYHAGFDAWVRVSHLRFGPSESQDRSFALAFWPDDRGSTPKTLMRLVQARDPAIDSPAEYAAVSIAARGFYALEYLLYDPMFSAEADADYTCGLIRALAADIAANAGAILSDWQDGYADLFVTAGENTTYRTQAEAFQELYKAVNAGLQFTADTRLGRPLGSFDRPRPNRAEARRSGRSLRHVILSLQATRDLALALAVGAPDVAAALQADFDTALLQAQALADDPVLAGVADPQGRLKAEVLQQTINLLRSTTLTRLGAALGVAQGFNSLDGD